MTRGAQLFVISLKHSSRVLAPTMMPSVSPTSGAHVGGHQNLLFAVPVALDDSCSLLHCHFPAQQRHLVTLLDEVRSQPRRHLAGLMTSLAQQHCSISVPIFVEIPLCRFMRKNKTTI